MSQQPTLALARFINQSRPDAIPERVVHEAKRAILNWIGCAVGASQHSTVVRALTALAPSRPRCWGAASASTSCTRR